ncbi:MAG: hypothetical protein CMM18_00810 [Rhodospirillaceae bacterium]|nr:hypothetical protein [Rhodospirillaceae bacterium]
MLFIKKKIIILPKYLKIVLLFIIFFSPNTLAEKIIIPSYFGSIKWNKVNVRTGPGQQYPIKWEFHKKNLPVEIISEHENWFKIRYFDEEEGWVHKRLISKKRYVMIKDSAQILRNKPDNLSNAVLIVENNVLAKVLKCKKKWCKIGINQKNGWILKSYLWGVYQNEVLN